MPASLFEVIFFLFFVALVALFQRRLRILRQNKEVRNILLVGPPGSGKTRLLYSFAGHKPPTTYTSLKPSSHTLVSKEFREFTKKGRTFILHDIPGMNFTPQQLLKFSEEKGLIKGVNVCDFVFVVDGTRLINVQYLEQFSRCLVEILAMQTCQAKQKLRALVVLTNSENSLFMHQGNAEELIKKSVRTARTLKMTSETKNSCVDNKETLGNVDMSFTSSNLTDYLLPDVLRWAVDE